MNLEFKDIQGNRVGWITETDLKDTYGNRVGWITETDIKDTYGNRAGYDGGTDIKDNFGNRVGYISGREIRDTYGNRIGYALGDATKEQMVAAALLLFKLGAKEAKSEVKETIQKSDIVTVSDNSSNDVDYIEYLGFDPAQLVEEARASSERTENMALELQAKEEQVEKTARAAFFEMLMNKRTDLLLDFFSQGFIDINKAIHEDGSLPLHYVAGMGSVEAVKWLLDNGAKIDAEGSLGKTPMHDAAITGNVEVLKYLQERGANLYKRTPTDKGDDSAMDWAAMFGKNASIKCLSDMGFNINTKDGDGKTPIFNAVSAGKINAVKYMIELGADINVKMNDGETLIHHAARYGQVEMLKYLETLGLDIYARCDQGTIPIASAAMEGKINVIEYLVEKGMDINSKAHGGVTPIFQAGWGRHLECMKRMKSLGAKLDVTAQNGKTPLDWAVEDGFTEIVEWICSTDPKLKEQFDQKQKEEQLKRKDSKPQQNEKPADSYTQKTETKVELPAEVKKKTGKYALVAIPAAILIAVIVLFLMRRQTYIQMQTARGYGEAAAGQESAQIFSEPELELPPISIKVLPSLPDPESKNIYRIQVGSFPDPNEASDITQQLRDAGFNTGEERYNEYYRVLIEGVSAPLVYRTVQRLEAMGFEEVWIRE